MNEAQLTAELTSAMLDARLGVVQAFLLNLLYAITPTLIVFLIWRYGDAILGLDFKKALNKLAEVDPRGFSIVLAVLLAGTFYLVGGIAPR